MAKMADGSYWCDGKVGEVRGPCNAVSVHQVSWTVNPSGLPGLGKTVSMDACGMHIHQVLTYVYTELVLTEVKVTKSTQVPVKAQVKAPVSHKTCVFEDSCPYCH